MNVLRRANILAHRKLLSIFSSKQQARSLSLLEHHAKHLLREFGVPVPRGILAETPVQVRDAVHELGARCVLKPLFVKSTVGNAPVKESYTVENPPQGEMLAQRLFSQHVETTQQGQSPRAKRVYVSEVVDHDREWYLCLTIDRENYKPVIVISSKQEIGSEKQTQENTAQIFTFGFSLTEGITKDIVDSISQCLNASVQQTSDLERILRGLLRIFTEKEATSLEISSLVQRSRDSRLVCLDARLTFDDAAEKRQTDLFRLREPGYEVQEEVEAEKYGLVYVKMDGNIGNVVNGAGLAMATNDAISLYGGSSANFLDAGGQATKETMQQAFRIITSDSRVKAILVNIYGGITRCDMIAESIIGAAHDLGPMRVPIVVRLQGTNSAEGLKLLEMADLGLHVEAGFGEAARKAVELAGMDEPKAPSNKT